MSIVNDAQFAPPTADEMLARGLVGGVNRDRLAELLREIDDQHGAGAARAARTRLRQNGMLVIEGVRQRRTTYRLDTGSTS